MRKMIIVHMAAATTTPLDRYDPKRWKRAEACCQDFGFRTGRALRAVLRENGVEAIAGPNDRVLLIDTYEVVHWLESLARHTS